MTFLFGNRSEMHRFCIRASSDNFLADSQSIRKNSLVVTNVPEFFEMFKKIVSVYEYLREHRHSESNRKHSKSDVRETFVKGADVIVLNSVLFVRLLKYFRIFVTMQTNTEKIRTCSTVLEFLGELTNTKPKP